MYVIISNFQAMFSDDEDSKPTDRSRVGESPANLSLLFSSPANQSGVFGSRGTTAANQPPGTPLKDVSNKFDFMKISGSPVKSRPTKPLAGWLNVRVVTSGN